MATNNISKDELRLLAHLHEHAVGYGEGFNFDSRVLLQALEMDESGFTKTVTYLSAFELVGARISRAGDGAATQSLIRWVWLTGHGENFMRELENQPGIGTKITSKTASFLYDTAKGVIVKVLGEFLAGRL